LLGLPVVKNNNTQNDCQLDQRHLKQAQALPTQSQLRYLIDPIAENGLSTNHCNFYILFIFQLRKLTNFLRLYSYTSGIYPFAKALDC